RDQRKPLEIAAPNTNKKPVAEGDLLFGFISDKKVCTAFGERSIPVVELSGRFIMRVELLGSSGREDFDKRSTPVICDFRFSPSFTEVKCRI
ncbi:2920_t:CDS:2, partial [Racocetra fulgida]